MYLNTMSVPMRHPWFDKPSMKRKQPSEESSSSYPAPKRRRATTLEHGFANLTLDAPMFPVDEPPSSSSSSLPPRPVTPTVPEITMKTSSWYEPEPDRIVVTDLDSQSDDEADGASPLISPALFDRLKARPLQPNILPLPSHSQALVLFRPLVFAKRAEDTTGVDAGSDAYANKDDAMDVEP